MKNISFDNPYLLLLIIPLLILIFVPFFISRNKDNRAIGWTASLIIHSAIAVLVTLAVAGIMSTSVLTKTTVYVVADVSYSSERNLDKIDGYIEEISKSLPENSALGVICFGRDSEVLTYAGGELKSVSEANINDDATDIVGALNLAESMFNTDSLKRIVLITDGNDTVNQDTASLAATVSRISENGIKIDAIFLDNTLGENEKEVQLIGADYSKSTYIGHENEATFLIQSSSDISVILELYMRERTDDEDAPEAEFEKINQTVVTLESGLASISLPLPSDKEGRFDYKARLVTDEDFSEHNNSRVFSQNVVGKTKILLISGNEADENLVRLAYGSSSEIDSYIISGKNNSVPFTLEDIIVYDEIVVSNVDIRDIRNINAFIDSLDMAISQYGKSLITFGDLHLQTNSEDRIFQKFSELLPLKFGNTNRDGRLYTIVLDVSHSMFMASKFTIAKDAAIKLLSILEDEDYVCLVTFSGEIMVQTPRKLGQCKQDLISYIDGLTTNHGTDIGMGLEEALKTVLALNLTENQVMLISDGFSFNNKKDAVEVAGELYGAGCTVSAINTFINADGQGGRETLHNIVGAGEGGNYYEISTPEKVSDIVFGDMADDVGDVIIKKDSKVNIERYKDGIAVGFDSFPSVSGYVLSIAKYDATVPLTVTYVKPNGYQETVPLYAYRAHGNGRVSSFSSNLSDSWTKNWSAEDKTAFVGNLFLSNTPSERIDRPFTYKVELTEYEAYVELTPSNLDPFAEAKLKITFPGGRRITRTLTFDSSKYFYSFDLSDTGAYRISLSYSYGDKTYSAEETFDIPYLPEYNAFCSFDKFNVYKFMRDNGKTLVDEIPNLENDKSEITTYKESYVIPLLIAAICLFVCDIVIRKLRISKKKAKQTKVG